MIWVASDTLSMPAIFACRNTETTSAVFADASARDNNSAGFGQMASAQHDGLCAYIEDVDEFQVRINGTWQRMGTKAEVDAASAEVALLNLYMEVL